MNNLQIVCDSPNGSACSPSNMELAERQRLVAALSGGGVGGVVPAAGSSAVAGSSYSHANTSHQQHQYPYQQQHQFHQHQRPPTASGMPMPTYQQKQSVMNTHTTNISSSSAVAPMSIEAHARQATVAADMRNGNSNSSNVGNGTSGGLMMLNGSHHHPYPTVSGVSSSNNNYQAPYQQQHGSGNPAPLTSAPSSSSSLAAGSVNTTSYAGVVGGGLTAGIMAPASNRASGVLQLSAGSGITTLTGVAATPSTGGIIPIPAAIPAAANTNTTCQQPQQHPLMVTTTGFTVEETKDIQARLQAAGHIYTASLTRQTQMVVAATRDSDKYRLAVAHGIAVVSVRWVRQYNCRSDVVLTVGAIGGGLSATAGGENGLGASSPTTTTASSSAITGANIQKAVDANGLAVHPYNGALVSTTSLSTADKATVLARHVTDSCCGITVQPELDRRCRFVVVPDAWEVLLQYKQYGLSGGGGGAAGGIGGGANSAGNNTTTTPPADHLGKSSLPLTNTSQDKIPPHLTIVLTSRQKHQLKSMEENPKYAFAMRYYPFMVLVPLRRFVEHVVWGSVLTSGTTSSSSAASAGGATTAAGSKTPASIAAVDTLNPEEQQSLQEANLLLIQQMLYPTLVVVPSTTSTTSAASVASTTAAHHQQQVLAMMPADLRAEWEAKVAAITLATPRPSSALMGGASGVASAASAAVIPPPAAVQQAPQQQSITPTNNANGGAVTALTLKQQQSLQHLQAAAAGGQHSTTAPPPKISPRRHVVVYISHTADEGTMVGGGSGGGGSGITTIAAAGAGLNTTPKRSSASQVIGYISSQVGGGGGGGRTPTNPSAANANAAAASMAVTHASSQASLLQETIALCSIIGFVRVPVMTAQVTHVIALDGGAVVVRDRLFEEDCGGSASSATASGTSMAANGANGGSGIFQRIDSGFLSLRTTRRAAVVTDATTPNTNAAGTNAPSSSKYNFDIVTIDWLRACAAQRTDGVNATVGGRGDSTTAIAVSAPLAPVDPYLFTRPTLTFTGMPRPMRKHLATLATSCGAIVMDDLVVGSLNPQTPMTTHLVVGRSGWARVATTHNYGTNNINCGSGTSTSSSVVIVPTIAPDVASSAKVKAILSRHKVGKSLNCHVVTEAWLLKCCGYEVVAAEDGGADGDGSKEVGVDNDADDEDALVGEEGDCDETTTAYPHSINGPQLAEAERGLGIRYRGGVKAWHAAKYPEDALDDSCSTCHANNSATIISRGVIASDRIKVPLPSPPPQPHHESAAVGHKRGREAGQDDAAGTARNHQHNNTASRGGQSNPLGGGSDSVFNVDDDDDDANTTHSSNKKNTGGGGIGCIADDAFAALMERLDKAVPSAPVGGGGGVGGVGGYELDTSAIVRNAAVPLPPPLPGSVSNSTSPAGNGGGGFGFLPAPPPLVAPPLPTRNTNLFSFASSPQRSSNKVGWAGAAAGIGGITPPFRQGTANTTHKSDRYMMTQYNPNGTNATNYDSQQVYYDHKDPYGLEDENASQLDPQLMELLNAMKGDAEAARHCGSVSGNGRSNTTTTASSSNLLGPLPDAGNGNSNSASAKLPPQGFQPSTRVQTSTSDTTVRSAMGGGGLLPSTTSRSPTTHDEMRNLLGNAGSGALDSNAGNTNASSSHHNHQQPQFPPKRANGTVSPSGRQSPQPAHNVNMGTGDYAGIVVGNGGLRKGVGGIVTSTIGNIGGGGRSPRSLSPSALSNQSNQQTTNIRKYCFFITRRVRDYLCGLHIDAKVLIASCGGTCVDSMWEATHYVADKLAKTETFLSCVAAGKWLLSPQYLEELSKMTVARGVTCHLHTSHGGGNGALNGNSPGRDSSIGNNFGAATLPMSVAEVPPDGVYHFLEEDAHEWSVTVHTASGGSAPPQVGEAGVADGTLNTINTNSAGVHFVSLNALAHACHYSRLAPVRPFALWGILLVCSAEARGKSFQTVSKMGGCVSARVMTRQDLRIIAEAWVEEYWELVFRLGPYSNVSPSSTSPHATLARNLSPPHLRPQQQQRLLQLLTEHVNYLESYRQRIIMAQMANEAAKNGNTSGAGAGAGGLTAQQLQLQQRLQNQPLDLTQVPDEVIGNSPLLTAVLEQRDRGLYGSLQPQVVSNTLSTPSTNLSFLAVQRVMRRGRGAAEAAAGASTTTSGGVPSSSPTGTNSSPKFYSRTPFPSVPPTIHSLLPFPDHTPPPSHISGKVRTADGIPPYTATTNGNGTASNLPNYLMLHDLYQNHSYLASRITHVLCEDKVIDTCDVFRAVAMAYSGSRSGPPLGEGNNRSLRANGGVGGVGGAVSSDGAAAPIFVDPPLPPHAGQPPPILRMEFYVHGLCVPRPHVDVRRFQYW